MKGIRVLSLLDKEMNAKIGKKGAAGDITIYTCKQGEVAVELIEPTLYPEKIHPLVFGLALSDFIVFKPDLASKELGEILASLIISGKPGAIVGDASLIGNYTKGTPLAQWESIEDDAIKVREKLLALKNGWKDGKTKIIVDQVFSLKSIGVVVLGAITSGKIRVHDKLTMFPLNAPVEVKSLQLHDANVEEISDGSRVGANIKGLDAEKIERGSVLGSGMLCGKKFDAEVKVPAFIKDGVRKDRKVFAYVGLQYAEAGVSADIPAGGSMKLGITCEKDFTYEAGETVFLVDPGRKPRIIGMGTIA
ncbi:Elongation factor 1-alpha [uncultured archaeon]|nr:Elongation factor 1-alpha [uncultured archaeon]